MLYNVRRNFGVVELLALSLVLTLGSLGAHAQTKSFAIVGIGPAPEGISLIPDNPKPHQAIGVGSAGLGKYSGGGSFEITGFLSATEANFSGNFTFVAANGDKLACNYGPGGTGVVTLIQDYPGVFRATFVAEFVPIPEQCTGKFKGVTGSWIMYAASGEFTIDATGESSPFIYGWEGEGKLTFPRR